MTARRSERGAAMVLALTAMVFIAALGVVLILTTSSETIIAGAFRTNEAARYAAEAAVERVLADLVAGGDWNAFLDGSIRSTFVDGAPGGVRTLSDGSTIDLDQQLNIGELSEGHRLLDRRDERGDRRPPMGRQQPALARWSRMRR